MNGINRWYLLSPYLKCLNSESPLHRDAQRARSYLIAVKIRPAQRDLNNTKVREKERRGGVFTAQIAAGPHLLSRQDMADGRTARSLTTPHIRSSHLRRYLSRVVRSPRASKCCNNVFSSFLFCNSSWLTFLLSYINYVGLRYNQSIGRDCKEFFADLSVVISVETSPELKKGLKTRMYVVV